MYTVRSYVYSLYERGTPTKTECCCTHSSDAREEGGEKRLNCEYVTLSRQTSSTRIAKHRSFIKLKFLQNFCSSCKTLADQVARNLRFYCILLSNHKITCLSPEGHHNLTVQVAIIANMSWTANNNWIVNTSFYNAEQYLFTALGNLVL